MKTKNKRTHREAIAYRRVSTEKQGETGGGLEEQMAAITAHADHEGIRIVDEFVDVSSGRGRRNLADRPGLQEAVARAKDLGCPIIVSGLDRVSRQTETVDHLVKEHGLTIISTGDGGLLNPVKIASEAARAQRKGDFISERTKDALARKKAEGVQLGNRTNLPEARKAASMRKRELAEQTVDEIVVVLEDLAGKPLNDRQLVDELNSRGIMTSTKRPWTLPAVRRPARAARQIVIGRSPFTLKDRYSTNPSFGKF